MIIIIIYIYIYYTLFFTYTSFFIIMYDIPMFGGWMFGGANKLIPAGYTCRQRRFGRK